VRNQQSRALIGRVAASDGGGIYLELAPGRLPVKY
jgi:hypothetical protein